MKDKGWKSMEPDNLFILEYLRQISKSQMIDAQEIPNIPLYMDQVLTFINEHLEHTKKDDGDKVLTKTMINNYAKNNVLPSPDKKKYSKDHMILLLFIYYFKNMLSIGDIRTLLEPLTENHFQLGSKSGLEDIYREITSIQDSAIEELSESLHKAWDMVSGLFSERDDKEMLRRFAFICLISYDVYLKRILIESMVDEMASGKKS